MQVVVPVVQVQVVAPVVQVQVVVAELVVADVVEVEVQLVVERASSSDGQSSSAASVPSRQS